MTTHYVLIDLENVQPKNLEILAKHSLKIFVFVGKTQTKLPLDLVSETQKLGIDGKYIQISGIAPDALDFHIAFYMGEISSRDPDAHFYIISKDKGFDPLVKHLKSRKISCQRRGDLTGIPGLGISPPTQDEEKKKPTVQKKKKKTTTKKKVASGNEKIDVIVENLIKRGKSKPRKIDTLTKTINHLLKNKKLSASETAALIKELQERKYLVIKEHEITYTLPKTYP